ncbi:MAG TPA: ATP-binding protein [Caulobacteraceae bacterium]|nr:ATP-binding protein [Caulobacteraceae bacterium]
MPFEQQPSPLAPAVRRPRPWGVPLAGGAGVALMLGLAASDGPHAERLLFAAAAAAAVTLLTSVQAFRFSRRQDEAAAPADQGGGFASPEPERGPGFQAVLEALPDPVMVVVASEPDDIVGRRIAFANSAARELLRIQGDSPLLVAAVRDPEVLEAVDEALFGGVGRIAAYETGGAQDRFWRAWTRPLPTPGDGARLALLYMRDETDSRRMERMRADFLANASHELRTPLASLSGFIETLRGHARDDAAARDKFLTIMAAQADRMGRLVADLLSLSRIELNEHIPPSGRVDLAMTVSDVIDALALLAREKQVGLEVVAPPKGHAVVTGERDQIVQVVQNLIDNAVKYSPAGSSVLVEVASDLTLDEATGGREPRAARLSLLTPDRSEARFALVRVRDRGPGIAREHLPRLTERFYRVEGQKSGERSGTGLGLAIVKHIMNRHRGGMLVESQPGEGSGFSVYFPKPVEARSYVPKAPAPAAEQRNKTVTEAS